MHENRFAWFHTQHNNPEEIRMSGDNVECFRPGDISIRAHRPGEERVMLEMWTRQGGDVSRYDYNAYMAIDPNNLLVAVDSVGEILGFGGVYHHDADTVYVAHFIVREDLRKKGIGKQIWQAMMTRCGERNIALDGAKAMVEFYRNQGFVYSTTRVILYLFVIPETIEVQIPSDIDMRPLEEDMWPELLEYDKQVYVNFDRARVLRAWYSLDDITVMVAYQGERIVGYGGIHRKTDTMFGVRNVLADDEHVAELITRILLQGVPKDSTVYAWMVEGKPIPDFLLRTAQRSQRHCERMYNKRCIDVNRDKIWIASAQIL
ncbi:uncharacterized protein LOC127877013 isoform X1 [Dreissena polymorpha]|uniref:N-acetyltransferase domain-containing protein n=2 Tax=Dreissena polymorpha TaxID=45954 RepID=A0A9D4QU60_DREPO|nr:uncharacterized protein LOC127877013 isoform X1 [Dreissena polymorpha]XP_052278550.1 uncharacterized protein LOC127877013 isoform X1 [Dreissena polymorpha]KAH3842370.1 hypothetical protein DPMN_115866 [Dreissena polymorpha]